MDRKTLERRGYSIGALRTLARRRLPRVVFDFCDGGAEDEQTLRDNERAFRELTLQPRVLRGVTRTAQSVELFGRPLRLPVLIGPTGASGMLWPKGEIAAARAAAAAGTVYTTSHGSTRTLEDIARAADGRTWFQVFLYRDQAITDDLIARARAAGYEALVVTVDNQVLGQRERDIVNGFTVPPRPGFRNVIDVAASVRWLWRMAGAPRPTMANYAPYFGESGTNIASLAATIAGMLDPTIGWDAIDRVRERWRGPMLLKGVLHPEDARLALRHGVDGLVVSNHGGRQLDGAPASIRALPAVLDAVDGRIPVLVDGGVRRGADVVKALALGATACLIARPHLWGLAVAGEEGVAHVLDVFRREIERVLWLGGWDDVASLGREALEIMPRTDLAAAAD
jgi:isopentenyl diphosphate isomerase/L-lactate dehydrogenase-like FMN-dependent dehydrogenase